MHIFLIGFMGAGKSSLGKRLASRLKLSFIDADRAIEKESGLTIPQIFEQKGEAGFRQMETEWLKNLSEGNQVIALGGGTPCFNDNLELIKSKGIVVYTKVPVPIMVSRLRNSTDNRPLIEEVKNDVGALTQLVEGMLKDRKPFYEQAHITFKADNVKAQDLDDLIGKIESY